MGRGTFLIAMQNHHWCIGYEKKWYGRYPDLKAAREAAIAIAKAHGEVSTQVIVRRPDGTEVLVWECQGKHRGSGAAIR